MNYQSAKQAALLLANEVSPDGNTQQGFTRLVTNLEKDWPEGNGERIIIRIIVGAIYDGLAYGNWPENK